MQTPPAPSLITALGVDDPTPMGTHGDEPSSCPAGRLHELAPGLLVGAQAGDGGAGPVGGADGAAASASASAGIEQTEDDLLPARSASGGCHRRSRAAVAEALLHDVPLTGGYLSWDTYSRVVMGRLRIPDELPRTPDTPGWPGPRGGATTPEPSSCSATRAAHAVALDPTFGRYFDAGPGLDWLIDSCSPLRVDVLPPS